jgi:urease subunit alpha
VTKSHMLLNDARPDVRVDADSFAVHVDGELIEPQPVDKLPMAQRYFLF